MEQYLQFDITVNSIDQSEVLIAALYEYGFEGFEERSDKLIAFIRKESFDADSFKETEEKYGLSYSVVELHSENWNRVWEENFQPVAVEGFCYVRAPFHAPAIGFQHQILITPKMSFGTGHHATTWMMLRQMKELDFNGKSVLDFGTGTGILSIMAVKLGAAKVFAIDNDEWSIRNAAENFEVNEVSDLTSLSMADKLPTSIENDIILANINRNVLMEHAFQLKTTLAPNGILLLSGLLEEDEESINNKFLEQGLRLEKKMTRSGWILLQYYRGDS